MIIKTNLKVGFHLCKWSLQRGFIAPSRQTRRRAQMRTMIYIYLYNSFKALLH